MKLRLAYILILFFFNDSGFLIGQVNPFEIEGRIDSAELILLQQQESIINTDNTVAPKEKELNATKENPFEVNHVPLLPSINKRGRSAEVQKLNRSKFISQTYIMWVLLICVIIVALITAQNRAYVSDLFSSLINNNAFNTLRKKEGGITNIYGILLYGVFTLSISVFLILLSQVMGLSSFGKVLAVVVIIYVVKHLCFALSAYILPQHELIKKYSFSVGSIHLVLGIILLPINILIYFNPTEGIGLVTYIGVIVIALALILRVLKGLFFSSKVVATYPFQFFMYLCAFEILPWLVIYRLLSNAGILN